MKLRARFIGKDGSLGYRNGHIYILTLKGNSIIIPTECPYGSVEAFLKNWHVLSVIETSNAFSFMATEKGKRSGKLGNS